MRDAIFSILCAPWKCHCHFKRQRYDPSMRAFLLLFLFATLSASADQLDVAIIRFPEPKDESALNEALASVDLRDLSNADHTKTRNPLLKGAVIFCQSLPLSSNLSTTTRFGTLQSQLVGSYRSGQIDIGITINEGVNEGFRKFVSRSFSGSLSLQKGRPRVVSLRTITHKNTSSVKGKIDVKHTSSTYAIVAQIR